MKLAFTVTALGIGGITLAFGNPAGFIGLIPAILHVTR